MYPTFCSSSVLMTMSAPHSLPNSNLRTSGFLKKPLPPPPPPPKQRRPSAFVEFRSTSRTRDRFLTHLSPQDLASLRLTCHDFDKRAAPVLFAEITITLRAKTFTKPARMAALDTIGHHVRTLTVSIPHSAETFLPPILAPTGEERDFVYIPQIKQPGTVAAHLASPKYGSWDMTELLIHQYGPMFHAATNIPSFIRAFTAMSSIRHLKISCPGQSPSDRYRRSVVDYALISLRIAVERAPLISLSTLCLLPIHPGGLLYLRSTLGFGSSPRGPRRWAQIKKLAMHMDGWDFASPNATTDQLKLLHDYLAQLSPNLERVSFRWKGIKGPSPFTLHTELYETSPTTSVSRRSRIRRLHFPRLKYMELASANPDASQVCGFIEEHRRTMQECDFEDIDLRTGDWDDAFAVLTRLSGSERWKEEQERHTPPIDRTGGCRIDRDGIGERESWFESQKHLDSFLRNSIVVA